MSSPPEIAETFACFGSMCAVRVSGDDAARTAAEAVSAAREQLLGWHERFSRFIADSELSRVNRDRRDVVPASPLMIRLAEAVRFAGALSQGLVDATLVGELVAAGYSDDLVSPTALGHALRLAPPRAPARARDQPGWSLIAVDPAAGTISRPPGVTIDSGGVAKGMLADVLAAELAVHDAFVVDCAGDLAIGGGAARRRPVNVVSPFDSRTLHTFELRGGAVATSGIGRRSWLDTAGRPAHHLLDPASGRPAFTGVVQATALAPTTLEAEVRAKAALLAGPACIRTWLRHGGLAVFDDGSHELVTPPPLVTLSQLSAFAQRLPATARDHC